MELLDKGKLTLFVLFIMPGFISLKIYSLVHPTADKDFTKLIIDAISYSCINYAFLFIPIYYVESIGLYFIAPIKYYLFYVAVLIVVPVLLPLLLIKLRRGKCVLRFLPHPTGRPWDYFFAKGKPCWIIVTLKNGKKYGGLYNSESFASGSPEVEQLYLEKHWCLDENGNFDHELKDTLGIIILTNEIESVEFIELKTQ